jgi:MFS family permease
MISFHTVGMYALSPVFGCLADRRGRIPVLAGGAAVLAVAFLVAGTAGPHDVTMLSFGLFLLGLGWSAALVSGSALLVEAVPPADWPGVQGRADLAVNLSGALGGAGLAVAATPSAVRNALAASLAAIVLAAVLRVPRRGRCVGAGCGRG